MQLLAAANELLVMPAVCRVVRDQHLRTPPAVAEHVRYWHRGNTMRNVRLRHDLIAAVRALNDAGLVPLLFKGSLQLVDGTLEPVGDRFMRDLDLLVPADGLELASVALEGIGYSLKPALGSLPHELVLERPDAPGDIELHVELGDEPIPKVLPAEEAWAESVSLELGVGRDSRPARARGLVPTHQVLHYILHSTLQDRCHALGDLPLRQLLTLSALARAHGTAVDWPVVHARMEHHGLVDELRSHVWLARRYAGLPLPPGDWGRRSWLHEMRVLVNFALVWPANVQRNLAYAFGREYLDSLYIHGDRPLPLAWARARHAARVVRREGWGAVRLARQRVT